MNPTQDTPAVGIEITLDPEIGAAEAQSPRAPSRRRPRQQRLRVLTRVVLVLALHGAALWASALPAAAGSTDAMGPLEDSPLFEKTNSLGNVVLLYTDTDGPRATSSMRQTAFDVLPPDASGLNAALLPQQDAELEPDAAGSLLGLENEIDVVTGDFDSNGFEEWAAAYSRRNGDIRVVIPTDLSRGEPDPISGIDELGFDPEQAVFVDLQEQGLPAQHPSNDYERPWRLRAATGELDGDDGVEIVVGYWDEENRVRIVVIDTDGSLFPRIAAEIASHELPRFVPRPLTGVPPSPDVLPSNETGTRSSIFDLATGDADGDGIDEIVLVAAEQKGTRDWRVTARLYRFDPSGAGALFEEFSSGELTGHQSGTQHIEFLEVEMGDAIPSLPGEEIAIALKIDVSTVLSNFDALNRMLLLSADLDNELFLFRVGARDVHTGQYDQYPMAMRMADFDGGGRSEIVVTSDTSVDLFRVDWTGFFSSSSFDLVGSAPRAQEWGNAGPMQGPLAVRDLDPGTAEGESAPEIVAATFVPGGPSGPGEKNGDRILLQYYRVEPAGGGAFDVRLATDNQDFRVGNAPNVFAIAPGRFNGPDISLGMPRRFSRTEITNPLIVLSAPPVHFDVFGATSFDVNGCFPVNTGCGFQSSYTRLEQSASTVTTEFHSDWALSEGVSAEGTLLGTTLEGSLRGTYGEGFSKVRGESRTETVSLGQTATVDDFIYAGTITYDVWEYPVYRGAEARPAGYVAVVRPRFEDPQGITTAWFNSKSWLAASFQPDHEVGNILSYREIAAPDEASGFAEEVRWRTGDLQTLTSQGGSGYWSLSSTEVNAVSTSRSAAISLEASVAGESGFDFDLLRFGPGSAKIRAQIDGVYEEESIRTVETRFEQTVGINFEFGSLDPSVGQTNYGVIPYAYWTKAGTLMLSYAVRPELGRLGSTNTFWQDQYGSGPDPTFILPWRHDPAKGFNLGSEPEVKRQQTRDIRLVPDDPAPGDTIQVLARVHNYSLQPSPPVEVRFYLGDPDAGGRRIFPNAPGPLFTSVIEPRESDVVSFEWTVPDEIDSARVYAVLDPDGDIRNEIHEDNNKAWNALAIPAPEPGQAIGQLAAALSFAGLARMRRHRGRRAAVRP